MHICTRICKIFIFIFLFLAWFELFQFYQMGSDLRHLTKWVQLDEIFIFLVRLELPPILLNGFRLEVKPLRLVIIIYPLEFVL